MPGVKTNWLAYPLTIKKDSPIKRVDLMKYLEKNKIQTRVLFAGNILHHPAYSKEDFKISGKLKNSDYILENSMLLGAHHAMSDEQMDYMIDVLERFINSK